MKLINRVTTGGVSECEKDEDSNEDRRFTVRVEKIEQEVKERSG